jgi:hypothetical protein
VLDRCDRRPDIGWKLLGRQQSKGRIEFINGSNRDDPRRILAGPGAVTESGGAVVAGTGGDPGQSIRHGRGIFGCRETQCDGGKFDSIKASA